MSCPHCESANSQTKAGMSQGKQRYQCGNCQRRYTERGETRGYSEEMRQKAGELYAEGNGIRQIARLLSVNHQTVANWLRARDSKSDEKATKKNSNSFSEPTVDIKRPSIGDVARQAGVSISSVSNFLNDKGHLSAVTQARIQNTIEDLSFTPNGLMRAIRRRRTRIIGVLMHGLGNLDSAVGRSVAPPLIAGLLHAAAAADYNVLLYPKLLYRLHESKSLEFLDGHIDGLIWFSPAIDDKVLERVARAGLPTIALLTRRVPDRVGFVDTDGSEAVQTGVQHLIDLDHRRIAYIGARGQSNFVDRHDGYRIALTEAGIKPNVKFDITLSTNWTDAEIDNAVTALQLIPSPPTAVVAATDSIAQGIIRAATQRGLRIPEDISVIGFDDIPDAASIGGGLTTIRQPFREVAILAVERLAALIAGETVESCRVTIPNELVVRCTTAVPRLNA